MDIKEIRAKVLGGDGRGDVPFEFEGVKFALKQPSIAALRRAEEGAKAVGKGTADAGRLITLLIVECVKDPETGAAVFSRGDIDGLESLSAGSGFIHEVSKLIKELAARTQGEAKQTF